MKDGKTFSNALLCIGLGAAFATLATVSRFWEERKEQSTPVAEPQPGEVVQMSSRER